MSARPLALVASLAVSALALAACGSGTSTASSPGRSAAPAAGGSGNLSVVASTDVYGAIAGAVGGPGVTVTSIIDSPDADPHEYESKPQDSVAVGKAALLIYNGAGYDDFATKILAASGAQPGSSGPATIDVADLSGLQADVPAGQEFNEHVWYNLPTVKKLADAIAADLGKADQSQAATFTANAQAFDSKIDAIAAKLDAIKAAHAGAKVAITEPVPLYMVDAAGLVNATPPEFSAAVEEGNDPPAAVLRDTLAIFSGPDKVKVLLPNAQTESPTTKQVEQAAQAAGVPEVPVTETLPAGVTDYAVWMGQQVDALSAALQKG